MKINVGNYVFVNNYLKQFEMSFLKPNFPYKVTKIDDGFYLICFGHKDFKYRVTNPIFAEHTKTKLYKILNNEG